MRIAQIAPLAERVPPKLYGGTERVVSWLTEELVRRGHDVTLFASGDSITSAELVPVAPCALRFDPDVRDHLPYTVLLAEEVRKRASQFDVLHFHIECVHFPIFRGIAGRTVTTLHGRLDLPDLAPLYKEFSEMPLVSISHAQRRPLANACWIGNVPHGMPTGLTRYRPRATGGYLAFLGRIAPEKRPDRAIEIARRAGVKLKIAAKVDRVDQEYFEREIRPLIDHPLVEWVGEIGEDRKPDFLGDALALLFPIDWPEPFGLVMIEAMACGTPTIAYPHGAVPEVIDHGTSGLIVDSQDAAVAAVKAVTEMDRAGVRRCFERRFTVERMVDSYLQIYDALATERPGAPPVDHDAADVLSGLMHYTADGGAGSSRTTNSS